MTRTEERLTAALAEAAAEVREESLRPLTAPARPQRRWTRMVAPAAAAVTAVVLVLGVETVVSHLTGHPPASRRGSGEPVIRVGGFPDQIAVDTAGGTIYTVDSRLGTLAMADAATCNAERTSGCGRVRHASTGGQNPQALAMDTRTRTLYVLNAGQTATLALINTATCNARTTSGCSPRPALIRLRVRNLPTAIALNPRTGTLYVIYNRSYLMSVIDGRLCNAAHPAGCAGAITTARLPTALPDGTPLTVDPATGTIYAGSNGQLLLIDGRTCNAGDVRGCATFRGSAPVDGGATSITIDPATGTIYAASAMDSAVTVINGRTCSALDVTGCGGPLRVIRGGPGPWAAAADPAARTVYLTNAGGAVAMLGTATCSAASVRACPLLPPSFPAGSLPQGMAADPAVHTLYVTDMLGGTVDLVNTAACNAADTRGCPRRPAPAVRPTGPHASPTWSFGGHQNPAFACGPAFAAYDSGLPAGPFIRQSVRVAAGTERGLRWTLYAKKGLADPFGTEQGGVVLNRRWYALCDGQLNHGPDGNLMLADIGGRGVAYGYVQHRNQVAIRLSSGAALPRPSSVLHGGMTFFISRLPRSACAYPAMTLKVTAAGGPAWSGHAYQRFGTCLPGRLVSKAGGEGGWGPGPGN